jgi:hypothetical protein
MIKKRQGSTLPCLLLFKSYLNTSILLQKDVYLCMFLLVYQREYKFCHFLK